MTAPRPYCEVTFDVSHDEKRGRRMAKYLQRLCPSVKAKWDRNLRTGAGDQWRVPNPPGAAISLCRILKSVGSRRRWPSRLQSGDLLSPGACHRACRAFLCEENCVAEPINRLN